LKPTYGRISRYGLVALGSSLDQLSPFTRTVEDAALLMQVMSGLDDNDSTTTEADVVLPELIDKDIKGMTIGLPKEYFAEGLDKDVEKVIRDAVTWYEQNGATVKEISLPHTKYAIATYYMVMCSEASSNLARFDGIRYGLSAKSDQLDQIYKVSRGQGFGEETKRRIMLGTYALSSGYYDAYYKKALQVRALLRQDFDKALEDVDCILTPVSPTVAWKIGEKIDDPLQMYLSDIYTISLNLTALPGMAVPCGFVKDLPVGFQLASKAFDELSMFKLAKAYQSDHDWHIQDPFGWSSLLDKKKES
jgi:aspartyl-tRNA(Asn)/glutamyl-tRNA(Gln) amidotransferase subunit A